MLNLEIFDMYRSELFLYVVVVGILLAPPAALACSCASVTDNSFLRGASASSLIVYAKVDRHTDKRNNIYLAMDLKVIHVLQGTHHEVELRVLGDNGILCRPYVKQFPVNSEWVFALNREGNSWVISGCGENWLRVENGRVKGKIIGDAVTDMCLYELFGLLKIRLLSAADRIIKWIDATWFQGLSVKFCDACF